MGALVYTVRAPFNNVVNGLNGPTESFFQRRLHSHLWAEANSAQLPELQRPCKLSPLPLEFPGVHYMDAKEVQVAVRVLNSRSLFRYYGVKLQKKVEKLEAEFAKALAVEKLISA